MTNLKPTLKLLLDEAKSLSISEVMHGAFAANEADTHQLSDIFTQRQFERLSKDWSEEDLNTAQDIIDLVLNGLQQ